MSPGAGCRYLPEGLGLRNFPPFCLSRNRSPGLRGERLHIAVSSAHCGSVGGGCYLFAGGSAAPAATLPSLGGDGADGLPTGKTHPPDPSLCGTAESRELPNQRQRIQPVHFRASLGFVPDSREKHSGNHRKNGIRSLHCHDGKSPGGLRGKNLPVGPFLCLPLPITRGADRGGGLE